MLDKRQGFSARLFLLHSKLAIGLSLLLFLVCVTGMFSLLRDEIRTWEQAHHNALYLTEAESFVAMSDDRQDQVITDLLQQLYQQGTAFIEAPIYIRLPYGQSDFAKVDFQPLLVNPETQKREWQSIYLHPDAPNVSFTSQEYSLSELFYRVHHELKLPNGEYVVGVATLFAMLIAISGMVLVWKQKRRLLQRSTQQGAASWRHWHRQLGVIALPVVLIVFFTGLILTLGIVFQASYALFLYDGNQKALRADAGYVSTTREPALDTANPNNQFAYPDVMRLLPYRLKQARKALAPFAVKYIAAYNLHAQNAMLEVEGFGTDDFPHRKRIHVELATGKIRYQTNNTYDNDVRRTMELVHQLHFGTFTGVWMKWLYVALSFVLCVLIVSGSLVWLSRYQKLRQASLESVRRWQASIIGGFSAVMSACVVAIFLARVLPSSEFLGIERGALVNSAFAVVLLGVFCASFLQDRTLPFFTGLTFNIPLLKVPRLSLQISQFTLLALLGVELLWLLHYSIREQLSWMLIEDILAANIGWLLLLVGVTGLRRVQLGAV